MRARETAGRLACLLLVLCLLSACGGAKSGLRLPQPPANGYVLDMSGALTEETTAHILERDRALFSATGAAVTVVTVDVLGDTDIARYANLLYEEWGLGTRGQKNGVLLVLAMDQGQYWAIQGEGIGQDLTDAVLEDLAWNYLERDFAAGDYDAGVHKLFDALYGWYSRFYTLEPASSSEGEQPAEDLPSPEPESGKKTGGFSVWLVVVPLAVAAVVAALYLRGRSRQDRARRRRRSSYRGGRGSR